MKQQRYFILILFFLFTSSVPVFCQVGQSAAGLVQKDGYIINWSIGSPITHIQFDSEPSASQMEEGELHAISIFPNPTTSTIFISNVVLTNQYTIEIVDQMGRQVRILKGWKSNLQIDVKDLLSGLYILKLTNMVSNQTTIHKFLKIN